jgi:thiamine biosynthesis lipoprotein
MDVCKVADQKNINTKKSVQKIFSALGTLNSISLPDHSGEEAIAAAVERVLELDDRFSVFKSGSEISRVNAAAGKEFVEIHPDTLQVIRTAVQFAGLSDGAFDITCRPLSALWGIGKKGGFIPSAQEISAARKLVNYKDIMIKEQQHAVMLKHPSQSIDLGAIAKGFAADEVRRILEEQGIENALINLGGTVIAMGSPRLIGIQHPLKPTGTPMGKLEVMDMAVVTSGSYEKFFVKDGVTYHHILDPRTGSPADSGLRSVTLIGKSAMELDALTTAVFVQGIEEGMKLVESSQVEAIFINKEQDILLTNGLKHKFTMLN